MDRAGEMGGEELQVDLGAERLKRDLVELRLRTREYGRELRDVSRAGRETGDALSRAFSDAILRGKDLSDVFKSLALRLGQRALNSAVEPLGQALGSSVQGLFNRVLTNADGNAFAQGRVVPLARGGIVDGPTFFPMRGGRTGVMGEAGPEAILPLARGPDGRLGVRTGGNGGGRNITINFNVATPDMAGFRRSETQIAAMLNRVAERGARNL